MSAEDRSHLIEVIQESTAGMTEREKLSMAVRWEWMAVELRRALATWREQPSPRPCQLQLFQE